MYIIVFRKRMCAIIKVDLNVKSVNYEGSQGPAVQYHGIWLGAPKLSVLDKKILMLKKSTSILCTLTIYTFQLFLDTYVLE